MKTVIYPGSFDPITFGHIDIIQRASLLFDKVIIGVLKNSTKTPLFSEEERLKLIADSTRKFSNVTAMGFSGLLVDFARENNAVAIIRGLRAISDFEYEFQMALMNRKLEENIATVFLMPNEKYTYLNSSLIKELAKFGSDVSEFVPDCVSEALRQKFLNK